MNFHAERSVQTIKNAGLPAFRAAHLSKYFWDFTSLDTTDKHNLLIFQNKPLSSA